MEGEEAMQNGAKKFGMGPISLLEYELIYEGKEKNINWREFNIKGIVVRFFYTSISREKERRRHNKKEHMIITILSAVQ